MGNEFAQFIEWNYKQGLDWLLLDYDRHRQMQSFVRTLNHFYLENRLPVGERFRLGRLPVGSPATTGTIRVIAFRRRSRKGQELIAVCNFCPVLREDYRLPLPKAGWYRPVLNTDDAKFGGYDFQPAAVHAEKEKQPQGEYAYSGRFRIPPMSVCFCEDTQETIRRNKRRKKNRRRFRYAIPEKTLRRHASGRRSGQPADGPDGKHRQARRTVRRKIPHHRFPAFQLRKLQASTPSVF